MSSVSGIDNAELCVDMIPACGPAKSAMTYRARLVVRIEGGRGSSVQLARRADSIFGES